MQKKIRLKANLQVAFGLQTHLFRPIPPVEIDELHYYMDDIPGDGRGLD
jgi:hypothetical protein